MQHLLILLMLIVSISVFAEPAPERVKDFILAIENPQSGDNEYDELTLAELMEELGVPGMSIAIVNDFSIHWAKGYGIADSKTGAKVDTSTLFQAASISKAVAAVVTLKQVEAGHFSLDDDINSILKSWQLPDSKFTKNQAVTPRALTSHTSGLGDGFGFPGYHPDDLVPTKVQILMGESPSNVGPVLMSMPPFVSMKYSGGGVTLMQLAVEDATGKPFSTLAQDIVFAPLDMSNSTFEQPLSKLRDQNAARAHDKKGEAMNTKWHVYPELAAAGLWTTPTDLATFLIEVQQSVHDRSNLMLKQSTVQEMLSPVGIGDYGIGFALSKRGQEWSFGHTGGNWGYRSVLSGHKLKGYGLAILTNGARGRELIAEIRRRVDRAYRWEE